MSSSDRPNAHIEAWLAEWRDEAKARGHQSQHTFSKALYSLRAYPLPLKSGKEAEILKNFGPALCKMIDKRLKDFSKESKNGNMPLGQPGPSQIASPAAASPAAKRPKKTTSTAKASQEENSSGTPKKTKSRQGKEYLPAYRSGGYAILVTLFKHQQDPTASRSYLTKTELTERAQPLCDTSFKPQARGGMPMGPNAFQYTAWSSMSTLIKKELVVKEGNPARFSLTEAGKALGERLSNGNSNSDEKPPSPLTESSQNSRASTSGSQQKPKARKVPSKYGVAGPILSNYVKGDDSSDDSNSENTIISHSQQSTQPVPALKKQASVPTTSSFVPKMAKSLSTVSSTSSRAPLQFDETLTNEVRELLASKADSGGIFPWEVVLCVDNQEYYGNNNKKALVAELLKLGVRSEVRRISVGDYIWILRRRHSQQSSEDIVLDYVVERKRIDDLVSSIIDGRFKEQKARMRNSGRPHAIYLVEEFAAWAATGTSNWRLSIDPSRLLQTAVNTLLIDDFELKMTRDNLHTAAMLAGISRQIEASVARAAHRCRLDKCNATLTNPLTSPVKFGQWNAASAKTKPMTIRETFTRQMMCIQGLSVDRALAITAQYPVPAVLLESCSTDKESLEKTLAGIRIGTRKLGPAVAKKIAHFYSQF